MKLCANTLYLYAVTGMSITARVTMKMTCSSTFREPATGLSCLPLYAGTRLYVKFNHMPYYCMGIFYA